MWGQNRNLGPGSQENYFFFEKNSDVGMEADIGLLDSKITIYVTSVRFSLCHSECHFESIYLRVCEGGK